mgnify:CR=1 FL=1
MAVPYSFINPRMQTYQGLKSSVSLAGKSLAKFDTLNAHIRDSVVLAGELVIIGDHSTKSCTSHEAYLMAKAVEVHHMLLIHGMVGDSYIVENYDFLQDILERTSVATGVVTDGWSRHLKNIESSLEEINTLYKSHLSLGKLQNRELFFQKRALLEAKIQSQLSSYASTGSGLGKNSRIKDMLGLSTKSYLKHGEIARYADTVAGVAKAATLIKRGGYIGVALDAFLAQHLLRRRDLFGPVPGIGHQPADALGVMPGQVAAPFQIARAPLRVIRPRQHPAFDVLAARHQLQGFGGIREQPRQLRAHPFAIQQRFGPAFVHAGVGGIGGVDRGQGLGQSAHQVLLQAAAGSSSA